MIELNKRFLPFYEKKARYKIAYGGRVGSKSTNIAILLLMIGMNKKVLIACLREYQKNLSESVYRLLCNKIIEDNGFQKHYRIMSDKIIGINGTEFAFSGIKNAKNFKSFEGVDIAWVEEAQTISAESIMITLPTIRKAGSEIWFSYNPDSEEDPVHKLALKPFVMDTEELQKAGYDVGQINLQINYMDNPHCPDIMKLEAEQMRNVDYDLYRHVWLGETRSASDSVIFKGKFEELDFDVENDYGIPRLNGDVLDLCYGLDFGWVHPTAIIETFRYKGDIYINNEIVGQEMDLDDIVTRIVNDMPWAKNKIIYGDSARPDLIEQLKYSRISKHGTELPGLNIQPANKGQGSVESGITWLKTHKKIFIHPRCQNTLNNFKKYCYKVDKNGIISTQILKINDDCIDALRYSYSGTIGENEVKIDWGDPEFLREIMIPSML